MPTYPAKGVIVKVAATATPTNVLNGLKEIGPVGGERETIDVTNHGCVFLQERDYFDGENGCHVSG